MYCRRQTNISIKGYSFIKLRKILLIKWKHTKEWHDIFTPNTLFSIYLHFPTQDLCIFSYQVQIYTFHFFCSTLWLFFWNEKKKLHVYKYIFLGILWIFRYKRCMHHVCIYVNTGSRRKKLGAIFVLFSAAMGNMDF